MFCSRRCLCELSDVRSQLLKLQAQVSVLCRSFAFRPVWATQEAPEASEASSDTSFTIVDEQDYEVLLDGVLKRHEGPDVRNGGDIMEDTKVDEEMPIDAPIRAPAISCDVGLHVQIIADQQDGVT